MLIKVLYGFGKEKKHFFIVIAVHKEFQLIITTVS
jgi:hypothetical protein